MSQKAPGKHYRKGISLIEIFQMFPDDESAEQWFVETRWPNGIECPVCGSSNIQTGIKHKTMPYRCRNYKVCGKKFSVKTNSVMESSKLGYQKWAIATYLLTTNFKRISSMKLHRDLKVAQSTAWHLAHRIRKSFEENGQNFNGPVEVDETYVGGLEKSKHWDKNLNAGRGGVGKSIVAGAKDRETNQVKAQVIPNTRKATPHDFVESNVAEGSEVFTDDLKSYENMKGYEHHSVKHSVGEYVDENIHINGMESFWSVLKRAHKGTFHKISHKHLDRYVTEFAGRHNARPLDTIDQMRSIAPGMVGKQLKYNDLVA